MDDHAIKLKMYLRNLERAIQHYTSDDPRAQDGRDPAIAWIKEMRRELTEITQEIVNHEFNTARSGIRVDTSDTMPCVLCNDHYALAGEHVRGVRWEPVPGKGFAYICWECAIALQEILNRQVNGLAYNLLFSLSKEARKLREGVPAVSKMENG